MVQGAVEFERDALQLICIGPWLVLQPLVVAQFAKLNEISQIFQDEVAIPIVDDDAQLVLADILLNVVDSQHDILIFCLTCIHPLAEVNEISQKTDESKNDGPDHSAIVVIAFTLEFLVEQDGYPEHHLDQHQEDLLPESFVQELLLDLVMRDSLVQNVA